MSRQRGLPGGSVTAVAEAVVQAPATVRFRPTIARLRSMSRSAQKLLMILPLLVCAPQVPAEVYQYRDRDGHVYLTDKPMQGPYRLVKRFSLAGTTAHSAGTLAQMRERRARLAPLIEAAARRHQLSSELVHAVVRAESAYQETVVSHKGAVGLMQLMPETARRLGVVNAYNPNENLLGGTSYLRQLLDLFDQDLRLALAAYNAGENAVIAYGHKIPPYPETQRYVEKVLAFYEQNLGRARLAQR